MINFLKNIFKPESETNSNFTTNLCAVSNGHAIPLSEVPDEVFSQKLAGEGMAIVTDSNLILAPADGELSLVFKTKHAFAMTLNNGIELLVHIGIDTVTLNGEGFEQLVEQGTKVKAGTPIIKIDKDFITSKGLSLITPVLITNVDIIKSITPIESGSLIAGESTAITIEI